MKHFILLFLLCLSILKSTAQDTVAVTVINQYKQKISNTLIKVSGHDYISDKLGNIIINDTGADSAAIVIKGYRNKNISLNNVRESHQLQLEKKFTWTDLLTPMFYILYGGIWLLLFIIFAETGLFIGFFFPGDSLLFVAGILSTTLVDSISLNTGIDFFNLLIIAGLCSFAGILGNTIGFITGRKVGPAMFNWRDRFLFRKKYLYQAKDFYDKHGGSAILLARFLPFVRTFAPIVAGIVNMDKKKFSYYNIAGSIAWVVSMLFIGHYLNTFTKKQFGFDLEAHLEVIVVGIVLVTTAPVLVKLFFSNKTSGPSI